MKQFCLNTVLSTTGQGAHVYFLDRREDLFILHGLELITCPIYIQNIQANYCIQGQNLSKGSQCYISTHVYDQELQIPFANLKA